MQLIMIILQIMMILMILTIMKKFQESLNLLERHNYRHVSKPANRLVYFYIVL